VTEPLPPSPDRPPRKRKRRRPLSPLAVDAKGLTQLLPFELRTIRTMDAAGRLPEPLRIGGRVCWLVCDIRAWLAAGAPDRETWAAIRDARNRNR
jgi:predicted DNA-binding transcriptional regulator AlpA